MTTHGGLTGDPVGAAAVADYLSWSRLAGHSPGTIDSRRRFLARLAAALPGPLLEVSPAGLLAWRKALAVGPDAAASYVSNVRTFYAWTVRAGLIPVSPAAELPVPRLARRLPRPIPEDHLMRAIADAPRRIRPWLVLAAWAGLRAKEIAYLRRENIMDTARPPVLLIPADAAKGRRERVVPLCDFALAELRVHGLPPRGWVFRRADHQGGPNQAWLISHLANDYLHDNGIPETLHQLRHRFGTQAYQASNDLLAVQELLGHQHPNTTAGYAAYSPAVALAAVRALPVPAVPARPGRPAAMS